MLRIFLSTFFIPSTTFVQINGKHMRKHIKIVTLSEENQTKAIIIKDIIGVDLIAITSGFINSYIKAFMLHTIPKTIPNIIDIAIPAKVLKIQNPTDCQKLILKINTFKVLITLIGAGTYSSLFINMYTSCQTIIQNAKTINLFNHLFFVVEALIW